MPESFLSAIQTSEFHIKIISYSFSRKFDIKKIKMKKYS